MDSQDRYVGARSASVVVSESMPRGFDQRGFGITKGRVYDGHLVMRSDVGAKVQVALLWGSGSDDRQIVTLPSPGPNWQSMSFEFAPGADARLEMTGTGIGKFRVTVVSVEIRRSPTRSSRRASITQRFARAAPPTRSM